ncbi:VCBS repeat-containing protein [Ferrimonas sediminum]|uniref:VCBS repeat-containing protein n=1 Tax=Ferrimonas sediminum TaxID=718193 RepID=A0A1G8RKB0_9GAMM|nr:Ig-like domain-containing protein [Ferrimonas sediminum]SDJ16945.1 VCBS repeat-containing protein [Ferrimonas sediminum]
MRSRNGFKPACLAVWSALLISPSLQADPVLLDGPSSGWIPLLQGVNFDPVDDEQSQTAGLDLVGDETHPQLYTQYDDKGTDDESDDEIGFRFRIGTANDSNVYLLGMDVNADGVLDMFISADGRSASLELWDSAAPNKAPPSGRAWNDGPSTTTIASKASLEIDGNAGDYHFASVSSVDPDVVDADIGNWEGNDHFVSFKFDFDDIKTTLSSLTGIGITRTSSLRYVIFSLTQTNSINGDFSGIHDKSSDYSKSFEELGLFTPPISPDYVPPVNSAPVAQADSHSVAEGALLTVNAAGVLGNDSDPDGDAITAKLVSGPGHASSFSLNNDGSFSYQHDGSATSNDSFSYRASDGALDSGSVSVSLTITPVNDAPVAVNDLISGASEDTPITVSVLGNDSDEEDSLSNAMVEFTDLAGGAISLSGGNWVYTPPANASGTLVLSYRLKDSGGAYSNTATVTINVAAVNDAPVAGNDTLGTDEDTPLTLSLLGNDSDAEDTLTNANIELVGTATGGSVTLNGGQWVFTPFDDFNGSAGFQYRLKDSAGVYSNTATVTINVAAVNDAPVAGNDTLNTGEDTPLPLSLLGNDSDDEDSLTNANIELVGSASGGTVALDGGHWVFTPSADFSGQAHFQYRLKDSGGGYSNTATVTINVAAVNDAPEGAPDSYSLDEGARLSVDAAAGVMSNDRDVDSTDLSVALASGPDYGVLTINADGSFDYQHDGSEVQRDGFSYTLSDDEHSVGPILVTLVIRGVNNAPVAVNDQVSVQEDSAKVIAVLANDFDAENAINPASVEVTTQPDQGQVSVNTANGTITYTPNANFDGQDRFHYRFRDQQEQLSNIAEVSITLVPVNDAPVANNDSVTTDEERPLLIPVLDNDSDPDTGDSLDVGSLVLVDAPALGNATVEQGSIRYTPAVNQVEASHFTYKVADQSGVFSEPATVFIAINAVNDAPVARPDSQSTREDQPLVLALLNNDEDVDGSLDNGSIRIVTPPSESQGTLDRREDGQWVFTPAADAHGEVTFTYQLVDDDGLASETVTVTLTITPVNDAPVANDDNATLAEDGEFAINILGNDSDVDGALVPGSVEILTTAEPGAVTLNGDTGLVTYVAPHNYFGPDRFQYRVQDDLGAWSNPAWVNITVTPVNDAPVARDDSGSVAEEGQLLLDLLANDSDSDGSLDVDSLSLVSQPEHGTLQPGGDGQVSYTPQTDFVGTDNFDYQVADNDGTLSNVARVSIEVTAVNDAPRALADAYHLAEGSLLSVADGVLTNDSDPDGDNLAAELVVEPARGSLTLNGDGSFSYQHDGSEHAQDSFSYRVFDGKAYSGVAVVTLSIGAVNDAPVAEDDSVTTQEELAVAITVLTNDSDAEGDRLTVALESQPALGQAQVLADGRIQYQPFPDQSGVDRFSYRISDGNGGSDTARVSVAIAAVNDAPVASDDFTATDVRTAVIVDALANDSDADGDALTLESAQAQFGQVTINPDQTLSYQPQADRPGIALVHYRISDGQGSSDSAVVSIDVSRRNQAPEALDDEVVLDEGQTQAIIAVLDNDSDADGDTLSLLGAASAQGSVTIDGTTLSFQAGDQFNGTATIDYRISDGFGGEDSATVLVLNQDALKPRITVPDDAYVDANALFTKVALGTATAEDRYGNPLPVSLVDGMPFFQPGDNTAFWQACDQEGRCATAPQKVYVRPLISLAKDQTVLEGDSVSVEVVMNGAHFQYPVTIPYSISGSADGDDHDLQAGELVIEAGSSAAIRFQIHQDSLTEGEETLVIRLDDDVNPGNTRQHTVTLSEANLVPELTLMAYQSGEPRLIAFQGQGPMEVRAHLFDPNADDSHSLSWVADSSMADLDNDDLTLTFNPDDVEPGLYPLALTATDNGGLSDTTGIYLEVRNTAAALIPNQDSDGDLIPDTEEGYADSDFDGIPDYLDQMTDECNVLPETGDNWDGYIVEGDPAVCLRVGSYSTGGVTGGAQIVDADIANEDDDLVADTEAQNVGGIFDFIAHNLPQMGQQLQVVMPQRLAIPANAVYRKFLPGEGWITLEEDLENLVHSAPGEPGYCPPPGGDLWTPGLTEGHWCVQLTLVDGGRYDADGLVNGAVVDPGGVAVMLTNNQAPVAQDDTLRLRAGDRAEVVVLDNDSDADSDRLSVVAASAGLGLVTINPDGSLNYQAPAGYLGSDRINYSISDGQGGSAYAAVEVTVFLNRAPHALDDSGQTDNNQAIDILVLGNDSDPDGDALRVTLASADQGQVTVIDGNTLRYLPPQGFVGTATLEYTITDGQGGSDTAQVQVKVTGNQIIKTEGGGGGSMSHGWIVVLVMLAALRRHSTHWVRAACLVLVAGLLVPGSQAVAEQAPLDPWFVSVQGNLARSEVSKSDLDDDFSDAGLNATTLSLDEERFGWGVGLGYFFTDSWFVEAGYLDIDEVELTMQGVFDDTDAFFDAIEHIYPESGSGPYAQLGYRHHFNDRLSLTGRLGAFFWEGDYNSFSLNGGTGNDNPDGTDLLYGLSLDYRLARDWVASLQAQRVEFDNYPTTTLGLSLAYHFGGSQQLSEPVTQVAPVVADGDGDGVADSQDACEGTPTVDAVDSRGCTRWRTESKEMKVLVLFANDSTDIAPRFHQVLADAARTINDHQLGGIKVFGHTSAPASSDYNRTLSQRRAEAVKDYLVEYHQLAPQALIVVAKGETELAVPTGAEDRQAQNRRVEIHLTYPVREAEHR